MYENVLSKGSIGPVEIKNRFVMPAMGSHHADEEHKVTQSMIDYYTARAEGGFGLLISEYTCVDPEGLATPDQLAVYSDDMIPGLTGLADAVHAAGAKMFLQLQHSGRETSPDVTGGQTVAPSAIPSPLFCNMPRPLTASEIGQIVERFGDGALRAKKAGFDGVEVQMGHGYLIGEFLSPACNKRIDEYGGSLTGRMKICLEIVKNIKEKCGKDFPVSCRLSGNEYVDGGITIMDSVVTARALEEAGADAIHVSVGAMPSLEYMVVPSNVPSGFNNQNIALVKNAVNIPVIGVGKITEPAMADALVADGTADFVAMGRSSIADPELPNKTACGCVDEITPCVGCLTRCWGEPGLKGDRWISCMMNPFAGYEGTMKIEAADQKKKIVVIGAGPGGMETAWIAAARGHEVVLLEKEPYVGGQLRIASIAPGKNDFGRAVKWFEVMCRKYGVDIRCNTEATPELIASLKPDEIVLTSGADTARINLDVKDIPVVTAFDILEGKEMLGSRVLILGGGMVGLETAEFAASQGRSVSVMEMFDHVGNGIGGASLFFIQENLKKHNVEIHTGTRFIRADAEKVVCEADGITKELKGYDMIVTAVGTRSCNSLQEELKNCEVPVHALGDVVKPGRAFTAIETAANLALEL